MAFELPALPFEKNALEPFVSARTLDLHHGRHHQTYITNLNNLIAETPLENLTLTEIVRQTAGKSDMTAVFNNAAQDWNHRFYWESLTPNGGSLPDGAFKDAVVEAFGSEDHFKTELKVAALSQFGSGWAWVVKDGDDIKIVKTSNADTPVAHDQVPLLTIDVWEHAYYIDYQNKRADYVSALIDHLLNWQFAAGNFDAAAE